ncbi:MAG: 1-acyl-sn-glycerol-3-phosphate acyltransferase [Proteobacteria bacterium]|nr:1-acyl-sn-glycerol-3-phosphate acyltransferase [Pseudomonadota bacterium]
MPHIDFGWRLVATGMAFAFVFGGGGLLAITVLPLLALLPSHSRARTQYIIHRIFRFYVGMLQVAGLLRLNLKDADRLKAAGGRIVVANHPSLLDVVLLISLIPRAQCVVKSELWLHPLLGPLMRRAGYIRNDLEPDLMVAACKAALEAGESLIIFPEGTRTEPGGLPQFRRGFANLAILTQATIQPVLITCFPPTLVKGEPWWRIPPKQPVFHLAVENCVYADSYMSYGYRSLATRKLVGHLQKIYSEKLANA